jgi:hypothetical protein
MAAGFAGPGGPGGPQAPYAEYQAWQPHGGPGGQPGHGPEGYAQVVNGGDYAYVIRHDDGPPAAPGQAPGRPAASGAQQATAASAGAAQAGPVRAITTGAVVTDGHSAVPAPAVSAASVPEAAAGPAGPAIQPDGATRASRPAGQGPVTPGGRTRPEVVPDVDPALAYGPDDPAYGPPGPDWYARDGQERTPAAGDAEPAAAEDDTTVTRGPFEPLRASDREAAATAGYQPADYHPGDDVAFDDPGAGGAESEVPEYDGEISELLGLGAPVDPEADALGEIRGLYDAAETVGETGLARHFDQLLERQRMLISEYFEEAGGLISADAATTAPVAPADAPVPFGFDTAESLASLRGELRGAQ